MGELIPDTFTFRCEDLRDAVDWMRQRTVSVFRGVRLQVLAVDMLEPVAARREEQRITALGLAMGVTAQCGQGGSSAVGPETSEGSFAHFLGVNLPHMHTEQSNVVKFGGAVLPSALICMQWQPLVLPRLGTVDVRGLPSILPSLQQRFTTHRGWARGYDNLKLAGERVGTGPCPSSGGLSRLRLGNACRCPSAR